MYIRQANTEDAAVACTLLRRSIAELCHADHGGNDILLGKSLSNKTVENVTQWIIQCHFLVAEEAGTVLGVAAMNEAGKIMLNYVLPEARFRGLSKALVRQLEALARARGLSECVLETTQTARRFCESLGYIKSEETYPLSLSGSYYGASEKIGFTPGVTLRDGAGTHCAEP